MSGDGYDFSGYVDALPDDNSPFATRAPTPLGPPGGAAAKAGKSPVGSSGTQAGIPPVQNSAGSNPLTDPDFAATSNQSLSGGADSIATLNSQGVETVTVSGTLTPLTPSAGSFDMETVTVLGVRPVDSGSASTGTNEDFLQEAANRGGGQPKGERGKTRSPQGTDNPDKKYKPGPTPGTRIFTDPHTGKKIEKPWPDDPRLQNNQLDSPCIVAGPGACGDNLYITPIPAPGIAIPEFPPIPMPLFLEPVIL